MPDILERFSHVMKAGAGWTARCPAHEDARNSLSISHGDTQPWLVKCHAGCDTETILGAAGLKLSDILTPRAGHAGTGSASKPEIVKAYDYYDAGGLLLYQVCRLSPKGFRQRRPEGKGWIWGLNGTPRVLYKLPELQGKATAYVVEGEKDADALHALGLPGTTSPAGAGKWLPQYTAQLRAAGVERVVVLPDHDAPGQKHGEDVAQNCHAAGLAVKVVTLPGLPPKGDVSDWLAQGHTRDELAALVKAAPLYTPPDPSTVDATAETPSPVLVRLSDVQPESVTWLWPSRIAAGKLTFISGNPGLGKSYITIDVAACVSTGRAWPDGHPGMAPADVVMLSAEDGVRDTIRPRLDACGADVRRVHHLGMVREVDGNERGIQLLDIGALEIAIRQTGAKVLTIDPLGAYLGGIDSHRDSEVRGLLAPLSALAERTGVAIVGVMHLSKNVQTQAIYRPGGSIAFTAAARVVLAVAADPARPERRILAPIKNNLTAPPDTLAYSMTDGRLTWEAGPVTDVDIDALLSGPPSQRDRDEQTGAEQVIADLLDDVAAWPLDAGDALKAGEAHGVHARTLRRAASAVGIRIMRQGFGRSGRWVWHRPDPIGDTIGDTNPSTQSVSPMAPMEKQAEIRESATIEAIGDTSTGFSRAREGGGTNGRF